MEIFQLRLIDLFNWQFLSIALCIPTVHDICVMSTQMSAWSSVRTYINIRDFPQAKLNREIIACFLQMSMVTHIFYFIMSMATVSSITEKKIAENYGYFFSK